MRTTIDLTNDSYQMAKSIARERDESLGRVISELILKAVEAPAGRTHQVEIVDGLPTVSLGRIVTSEDVNRFIQEDE